MKKILFRSFVPSPNPILLRIKCGASVLLIPLERQLLMLVNPTHQSQLEWLMSVFTQLALANLLGRME